MNHYFRVQPVAQDPVLSLCAVNATGYELVVAFDENDDMMWHAGDLLPVTSGQYYPCCVVGIDSGAQLHRVNVQLYTDGVSYWVHADDEAHFW